MQHLFTYNVNDKYDIDNPAVPTIFSIFNKNTMSKNDANYTSVL